LRTSISKKLHLGPQNGPGSENLLKIVNCQNGQKTVLSHLEKVGGPDIHLDHEAIRMFLEFVCFKYFKIYERDVKSKFLNGTLEEEVYVEQLEGFILSENQDYV
jgi:hypothetical protein